MNESTKSIVLLNIVYGHKILTEPNYFHIGSGSEQRAKNFKGRSKEWRDYVEARGGVLQVEVKILERYICPARARLREMELVNLYQPTTNYFGRFSIPEGILDGRPKGSTQRCMCGAPDCYGAQVALQRR
jgi:hypothetical protein